MSRNKKYNLDQFINDDYLRCFFFQKMIECAKEIEYLAKQLKNTGNDDLIEDELSKYITKLSEWEKCHEYINSKCNHDLVLHLGKIDQDNPDKGYAVCLMCKKEFLVDGLEHESVIFPENVINVDGILSPVYTKAFDGKENILAIRAREKLMQIATSEEADKTYEEIKEDILEDLVYYTDDLEYRQIKPRKRARVISEK